MPSLIPNIPNLIVMIRPAGFGFNAQTASSNAFQRAANEGPTEARAIAEFDAMIENLIGAGIPVKVFDDQRSDLPDSVFSNNWIAQLPEKKVIVFPMHAENRRDEVRDDIVEWVRNETACNSVIDLRGHVAENRFLEGTGSVVFDYRSKKAYACESPRTDIPLFESFCSTIGYEPVSFRAVDLKGMPVYHTNVVMTVCNGYAMVCFDAIEDELERMMLHVKLEGTGHDLIPLSLQQMNHFAGNCIEVLSNSGQSYLLMSKTASSSLTDLQKYAIGKYSKILDFEIPTIEQVGGGSVRCMITGLFKD